MYMLFRLWKMLVRFRWPGLVALTLFAILCYTLQPRPVREYRLADDTFNSWFISPSGNYVAARRESRLTIHHLDSNREIGSHPFHELSEVRFDADDNLHFASYTSNKATPDGARSNAGVLVLEARHRLAEAGRHLQALSALASVRRSLLFRDL